MRERKKRAKTAMAWIADDEPPTFEYVDIDSVDDALLCNICNWPYTDPKYTECCGYTLCSTCAMQYKYESVANTCPECREKIREWKPCTRKSHREWLKLFSDIVVTCKQPYCAWKGPRDEFRDHIRIDHHHLLHLLEQSDDDDVSVDSSGGATVTDTSADLVARECVDESSDLDDMFDDIASSDENAASDSSSETHERSVVDDGGGSEEFDDMYADVSRDADDTDAIDSDQEELYSDGGNVHENDAYDDDFFSMAFASESGRSGTTAMQKAFEMACSTNDHDWRAYGDPIWRLMPNAKRELNREDIPVMRDKSNQEIYRERKTVEALENNAGVFQYAWSRLQHRHPKRHEFGVLYPCSGETNDVSMKVYHRFASLSEANGYLNGRWLIDSPGSRAEGDVFVIDKRFPKPLRFFMYEFTSVNEHMERRKITVTNVGVSEDVCTHKYWLRKALSQHDAVIDAKPVPWSTHAWHEIVQHLTAGADSSELYLEKSAFGSQHSDSPLSEVFFDVIEAQMLTSDRDSIRYKALRTLFCSSAYVKYFFHREIVYLNEHWYDSIESLIALRPRALYALYHILHPEGDSVIKQAMYRYLWVRDQKSLADVEREWTSTGKLCSKALRRLVCDHTLTIEKMFECSTYRYRWPLPVFTTRVYRRMITAMKIPKRVLECAENERLRSALLMKQAYESICGEASGDTCVSYSVLRLSHSVDKSRVEQCNEELYERTRALAKVPVGDNDEYVVTARWRQDYAEMLYDSIKQLIHHYMLKNGDRVEHGECSIHRVYKFPEPHPMCESKLRFPLHQYKPSSEQLRAVRAMEALPMHVIVGSAGSGKTEAMCAVAQGYHPYTVFGVVSQNATAMSVVVERVCKRTMTATRLQILHAQRCLWRTNNTAKNATKAYLQQKPNPYRNAEQMKNDPGTQHLCDGEYYCTRFKSAFDYCPLERAKLVMIDEASIMSVQDFANIVYIFVRCCQLSPPKFLICGDRAQLPAIDGGDLLKSLMIGLSWTLSEFRLNFRFPPTSLLMRNATAIRHGRTELVEFDLNSELISGGAAGENEDAEDEYDPRFGSLRSRKRSREHLSLSYVTDKPMVDSKIPEHEYHLVRVESPLYHDDQVIQELIEPPIVHLLEHDKDFQRMLEIGETSAYQFACPTNNLCWSIFQIVEERVFIPRTHRMGWPQIRTPARSEKRMRVYANQKIVYKRNVYPAGLCNNLVLYVVRIEDVLVPKKMSNDALPETKSIIEDERGGDNNDVTNQTDTNPKERRALRYGENNVTSRMEDIVNEHTVFKNAKRYVGNGRVSADVPSTLCSKPLAPMHARSTMSVGRRIIAVPAADVDKDGNVTNISNCVCIPYTDYHINWIKPATAVTIHSAQGTESETIAVVMPTYYEKHTTRHMLYVAVTRAKKKVVLISNNNVIGQCLNTLDDSRETYLGRYLQHKIKSDFGDRVPLTMPKDTTEIITAGEREKGRMKEESDNLKEMEERSREKAKEREERQAQAQKARAAGVDQDLLDSLLGRRSRARRK